MGELAEVSEARHRNPTRDWRWDGGKGDVRDQGRPQALGQEGRHLLGRNGVAKARAKGLLAHEGSERLIVAMKPRETGGE